MIALGPGSMVGAEALNHSANYQATVTAETDMRVIAFPADELRRLCRKYPLLKRRIERSLTRAGNGAHGPDLRTRIEELEIENARLRRALTDMILGNPRSDPTPR